MFSKLAVCAVLFLAWKIFRFDQEIKAKFLHLNAVRHARSANTIRVSYTYGAGGGGGSYSGGNV